MEWRMKREGEDVVSLDSPNESFSEQLLRQHIKAHCIIALIETIESWLSQEPNVQVS